MEMEKYVLVQWPDSQALMEYDWFEEECSLADEKFGSSAYFVPESRIAEMSAEKK
jgi:hypothetical protein